MLKKYCKLQSDCGNINYIVYFPEDRKKNMPLLLFLHGIGERGDNIQNVEKYALPKYMNRFDIPYIVVAPPCRANHFWDYHLRDVEKVLEEVYREYHMIRIEFVFWEVVWVLLEPLIILCQGQTCLKELYRYLVVLCCQFKKRCFL